MHIAVAGGLLKGNCCVLYLREAGVYVDSQCEGVVDSFL